MATSKKKRRGRKKAGSECSIGDETRDFKTLFPVILSPEGIKPPVLKNLLCLLVALSSNAQWIAKFAVNSHEFDLEICYSGIRVTFVDICELSNVLFKELEERFEQLYSTSSEMSASRVVGESSSNFNLFDAVEVMDLLLRCCMSLLTLLAARQNLVLEKGKVLLMILRKLSLTNLVENRGRRALLFEKSVFRKCDPADNGCTTSSAEGFSASFQFLDPHNPLLFFMSTMLEVFIDELLLHGTLRGYFTMTNSVASVNEKFLIPHSAQSDIGIMMEALSNHFILSFSDKQVFGDFLTRLFSLHTSELKYPFRASGIGMPAAVSLLHSPIMTSAPKYMRAHLISLVSEATYVPMNIKASKPDRKLTNTFLSIFEKSVILYRAHVSFVSLNDPSTSAGGFSAISTSPEVTYLSFELFISPDTKNKLDNLIMELDNSLNPNSKDSFFAMKSDMVSSSMRFIKECQNVYGMSCQDEVLAILSCLILKASESFDDTIIQPIEGAAMQNIYLLASLMKLMSTSLLQAIWCLRHTDESSCQKTLKDFSSCGEYDFMLRTISFFKDSDFSLQLQQVLSNVMSSHSMRHVHSKTMFLHFLGLMSVGFARGIDCIVKGCLLANLAILNLFVFEEGNLDALQLLVDSEAASFSSSLPVVRFHETVVDRNSSLVVASKFQKISSQHLSVNEKRYKEMSASSSRTPTSTSPMDLAAGLEEETEETANGEIFLNCLLKKGEKIYDFDDLVGFIECKEGKDYSDWLKNRQRYNKKKFEKMAVLRWKRKKKTWRTCKGKRA